MIFDLFNQEMPKKLRVRVTPRASSERIKIETLPDGERLVRVYVTVVAEDGKANKAVIALLAKTLGLPPSALKIAQGLTSRDKLIEINYKPE